MKLNKILILIVLLLLVFTESLLAQKKTKIDSINYLLNNNLLTSAEQQINLLTKDTFYIDKSHKAEIYLLLGKFYDKKNKEELALEYLTKAEIIFKQLSNFENLAKVNFLKFVLFKSREHLNTDKQSELYLDKYYKYAIKTNDSLKLKNAFMGYGMLNMNKDNYTKSLQYYDKAMVISKHFKDSLTIAKIYSNKSIIMSYYKNKQDSAIYFYKKALLLFKSLNKNDKVFGTYLNLGLSYMSTHNQQKALTYFYKADAIPIKNHKNNSKRLLYGLMANSYEATKDYKNAFNYLNKYIDYKDSVDIKAQNIAISDIQTKYETAEKEKNIIKLKAEKQKQKGFLIIFALAFIASLLVGLSAYRNQKRKKDLAEKNQLLAENKQQFEHQKVKNLIKEQELKILDAVMEGQTKERKRIAEDLHDNLGSKLAVLKFQFDSFNESVQNDVNLSKIANNTSKLLEDTYQTVRGMSHAENAKKTQHSLVHLIKLLAANISKTNKLKITVENFGFDKSLDNALEIMIFRIVQELITNIIKYAQAQNINIDLNLFDNSLNIIVSDNGKGFNTESLKTKSNGMGLKSIKKRITDLKGSIEIDSEIGVGTTVIIDLPIQFKNI